MKKEFFISILFAYSICFSQAHQEWVARFNGSGNFDDQAVSVVIGGPGNIYVAGYSNGITSKKDFTTIKYNSNGIQQWVQSYNGSGNNDDYVCSMTVDLNGNVIVTGQSIGAGTNYDYATIKYNSEGVQQWVQRYNGPANSFDLANSIAVDNLGNIFVTGSSRANVSGDDIVTIKYSSSGVEQWIQRYNSPSNGADVANTIKISSAGNIYVTGYGGTGYDYVTIKYSNDGVQQWMQTYNGPGNNMDVATNLFVDNSENAFVTGYSAGSGSSLDFATMKYNSIGVQQWLQRYNGPGNGDDEPFSAAVDLFGNVYVTGWSALNNVGDIATIKYNSNGILQWVQRYNGSAYGDDISYSLALDDSCNLFVAGTSAVIPYNNNLIVIKYNSTGIQQWLQSYNGTGNGYDAAYSLCLDNFGNVYATGFSYGNGSGYDIVTIKYSQTIGISLISNDVPNDFKLFQNYPNPFNPTTKIKFSIPNNSPSFMIGRQGGLTTLKIYDILGGEVATLVNEKLQPGTYEAEFYSTNYPSGVYFYKLEAGNFSKTNKMILIK